MDIELLNSIVDYGIIGILGFMSFLTLFFWIERLIYYSVIEIDEYDNQEELEIDITNNLSIIYSCGANAPYIGLLGTVLGIIITFYTIGKSGNIDTTSIMSSLAIALKSTAMGLVVAIPAIFFYNHLNRKVDILIAEWSIYKKEN